MSIDSTLPAHYAGKFKPRATTYNGVEMRSRLEARYAAWLDGHNARWDYEPQCFATVSGQYLPDFRIHDIMVLGAPRTIYVEVKPTLELITATLLGRMGVIWKSDPDAFLISETPKANPFVLFPPDLHCRPMIMMWQRTNAGELALAPQLKQWGGD